MASLQGLPPLPRSLRGLLQAGSAQWKETERRLMIKASIHQDLQQQRTQLNGCPNGLDFGHGSKRAGHVATRRSLDAAIAHLRREMVGLRQLDMSLLCQLWSLNEALLELKSSLHERSSESNSECSSYGLEGGSDAVPRLAEVEEEEELLAMEARRSLVDSLLGEARLRSSAADSVLEASITEDDTFLNPLACSKNFHRERQSSYHGQTDTYCEIDEAMIQRRFSHSSETNI